LVRASLGEIDVGAAGKQPGGIPFALAVTDEREQSFGHRLSLIAIPPD
jgi:hypothetical protein